jgi:WD repeat-containing protein 6
VFFGQKRLQCVQDLPESTAAALAQPTDLARVGTAKACSDWIFDVQILSEHASADTFPTIAIGLAHNFIQLWDAHSNQVLRTVICSERCILYSLSFYGRCVEDLLVASGTVFQQVLLWDIDGTLDRADPKQRLHGHDGVIFKLEWSHDARMLASVSDDRTVQLWTNHSDVTETFSSSERLTRPWISRFRAWGHTARLWDVRFCGSNLVTTSEDGMCKVWRVSDGTCVATLQGHAGKHVWRVAVHPSAQMLATGGGGGAVKLWDLPQQIKSSIASAGADSEVVRLVPEPEQVVTKKKKTASLSIRDIVITRGSQSAQGFIAVEDGRIYELDLEAPTTRTRLLFTVADKTHSDAVPNVSSFAMDDDEKVLLIGDASGSVVVLDIATLAVRAVWKAHASRIMKIWWNRAAYGTLFTCGADGGVREWRIPDDKGQELPTLMVDYRGPAKCATSSIAIVDIAATRNMICGDARANLFGFSRPLVGDTSVEAPADPSFAMRGIHGRDMIATLLHDNRLVYSGGHDGYICSYLVDSTDTGVVTLRFIGRESIKGITTIKQLWLNDQRDLMVFGFHATFAVLYNHTAQYRLFNVECGGWRRPHALRLLASGSSTPAHTFVFTPVTKQSELLVQVHSTSSTIQSVVVIASASLHHCYHGRTTTCVQAIGTDRLVTASEDNALKLHRYLPVKTVAGIPMVNRWKCLSTGVAHTTTIRALHAFYLASQKAHIVLSGGGKQRLNAWRVRDDLDVMEFLCGQEVSDADQDHRILGLTSFSTSDRCHVIVATNSEGAIQILRLDLGESISSPTLLQELGQCSSSKKPILSCDGVQISGRALLAVGSTDGMINVWDLTHVLSLAADESMDRSALASSVQQLQPVYKYLAHDMGTNCLCISRVPGDAASRRFRIISGGDDQNLHVHELSADSLELVHESHVRNASGSALKAVTTSRDGHFIYCAGYDQRVSQWACGDDAKLAWQCAAFTECADIADLSVMTTPSGSADSVAVVGQGLQTVQFRAT